MRIDNVDDQLEGLAEDCRHMTGAHGGVLSFLRQAFELGRSEATRRAIASSHRADGVVRRAAPPPA